MSIPDPIERGEESAERAFDELQRDGGMMECYQCGAVFNAEKEGGTLSPDPYAMPVCGKCLCADELATAQRKISELVARLEKSDKDNAHLKSEAQTNLAGWNLANEQMLAKLKKLDDFIESERQGASLPSDTIEAAIFIMQERGKQVKRMANTRTPITSLIGKETILNHFRTINRKEALRQLAAIIDGPIGDKLTGEEMAQSELYNAVQWIQDEIGD